LGSLGLRKQLPSTATRALRLLFEMHHPCHNSNQVSTTPRYLSLSLSRSVSFSLSTSPPGHDLNNESPLPGRASSGSRHCQGSEVLHGSNMDNIPPNAILSWTCVGPLCGQTEPGEVGGQNLVLA